MPVLVADRSLNLVRGVDLCVMRQALGAEEEGAKRKPRGGGALRVHALGGWAPSAA